MKVVLNDNLTEIRYSVNKVEFIIGHNRKIIPKLFIPSLVSALFFLFAFKIASGEIMIILFILVLILTSLIQIREVVFDKSKSTVSSRYILWGIKFRKKILLQPMEKFKYEIKYCEIDNPEFSTIKGYQLSGKRGNKEIDLVFLRKQNDLETVISILRDSLNINIVIS